MDDFKVGDQVLVQVLIQENIWAVATIVDIHGEGYRIAYKDSGSRYYKEADQMRVL